MPALSTILVLRVGDAEAEYAATVTYTWWSGFAGNSLEPPEAASCEVTGITLDFTATKRIALDHLIIAELADQLQPELLADWEDSRIAAAEYRAEQRRDDAMMERLS